MNANANIDINSDLFLNSLLKLENDYKDSDIVSLKNREFKVGYCVENFNGQKVMILNQKKFIQHKFFGPLYPSHTFEGEVINAIIIGWKLKCIRLIDDDYGGNWERINQVLGTNHFKFRITASFMRDLNWEINIYYILK